MRRLLKSFLLCIAKFVRWSEWHTVFMTLPFNVRQARLSLWNNAMLLFDIHYTVCYGWHPETHPRVCFHFHAEFGHSRPKSLSTSRSSKKFGIPWPCRLRLGAADPWKHPKCRLPCGIWSLLVKQFEKWRWRKIGPLTSHFSRSLKVIGTDIYQSDTCDYCTSECTACRVWYCFSNSISPSIHRSCCGIVSKWMCLKKPDPYDISEQLR